MRPRDVVELIGLAAIWGASFLFMRVAAPEFGPVALAWLRVALAGALLLPLLVWRGQFGSLRRHWRPIALVGLSNSALPFVLFSVAALAIDVGLSAIFNATTPLWGALIGALWLHERSSRWRRVGLAIGFAGVLALGWDQASLRPGAHGVSPALAIGACLAAALLYGFSANFTRRHLSGASALALATGSQLAAAVALAPLALATWPAVAPGALSWSAALALAVLCTGVAYTLYFRLIAHVGPAAAMSVTFLIPVFAMLWGWWLLDEAVGPAMLAGGAAVLAGTALVNGLLPRPRRAPIIDREPSGDGDELPGDPVAARRPGDPLGADGAR